MNRLIYLIAFCVAAIVSHAQNNVGINTNSPQANLDVRGTQRVGGINSYMLFDSTTGRIQWSGAALYAPVSQHIISHSASSEGLYAGGGKLEYRNTTDDAFFSDWTTGNGYFKNNLGINNPNPQFPLSFNGSLGDKISLWTDGTLTFYGLGVQSGLLQLFSKTASDDIAFGFGSSNLFTERMRVKGNGNVGIGNSAPYSPLSFASALGEKISMWGTAANNYGLGIQSSLLQIHTDVSTADIAFGFGSSSAFTERMRIKGTGNVGIGNNNPGYLLDVSGRLRVRNGVGGSAGMWFNNTSNVEAAFVGMQDDTHVGLWGNDGAGWKFAMNTQSGAIALNGNDGAAGQVMQSNGTNGAATWAAMASVLPTYYVGNNVLASSYVDVPAPGEYAMNNGSITLTVAGNSRLMISATYVQYTFCPLVGSCNGTARCYFKVDGASTEGQSVMVQSGGGYASGTLANFFYDVGAGSHTIAFYTRPEIGSTHYWMYLQNASIIVLKQ